MKTTITYKKIDFDVEYNYIPGERPVYYDSNGEGYPGCAPEVEITLIEIGGQDVSDLLEEKHWDEIEELIADGHGY
jgi:hypothetical protein